jgi:hypothetical protein
VSDCVLHLHTLTEPILSLYGRLKGYSVVVVVAVSARYLRFTQRSEIPGPSAQVLLGIPQAASEFLRYPKHLRVAPSLVLSTWSLSRY